MSQEEAQPAGQGDRVVESGETMVSLAEESGHFWQTLWQHPDNAELKAARKRPNVLLAGDRVTIPPLRPKSEIVKTGKRHRFRRKGVPTQVKFRVAVQGGEVFPGKEYLLKVGQDEHRGTTDSEGRLEEFVTTSSRQGELTVWLDTPGFPESVTWNLSIGSLGPIGTMHGIRARLTSMGYDAGTGADAMDDRLQGALKVFQENQELEVTGELDEATRTAIETAYGY